MTQSQHIQKPLKKISAKCPMLNFTRWTPTLGLLFKWNDQKGPKIAHFCVSSHIGGSGGVRKHMDPKIQWVMANCSKNRGSWTSWGPTIIFSEKKPRTFEFLYTKTYTKFTFCKKFGPNRPIQPSAVVRIFYCRLYGVPTTNQMISTKSQW